MVINVGAEIISNANEGQNLGYLLNDDDNNKNENDKKDKNENKESEADIIKSQN